MSTVTLTVTGVSSSGQITSFVITGAGQFSGALPTSFTQQSTSGSGTGVCFTSPTWQKVADASGSNGIRPDKLENGNFVRQISLPPPNQIDYPLSLIQSREDYSKLALKQLISFPSYIFYDPTWPLGVIYPWPVPAANIYEIHVLIKETLPVLTSLTQILNIPFSYFNAMVTNLAVRLRSRFGLRAMPGDDLNVRAKIALQDLRGSNSALAQLQTPKDLSNSGQYNIFSDRSY